VDLNGLAGELFTWCRAKPFCDAGFHDGWSKHPLAALLYSYAMPQVRCVLA
jgi:hypothetical protein